MATQTMGTSDGLAVRPVEFVVESASRPGMTHRVRLADCDCEDFRYRRTRRSNPFCKHILAAYRMAGWHMPVMLTEGLLSDEVVELLDAYGVSRHSAAVVVRHARQQGGAGVPVNGDGALAVVTYSHSGGLFTVKLPG